MEKDIVKAVQQRLQELGWYEGKIDGIAGVGTQNAVQGFKEATGLKANWFVGPITLHALFDDAAKRKNPQPTFLPAVTDAQADWMRVARQLEGTREVAGAPSNPTILSWAAYLDLSAQYTNDGIAWCGLFVAFTQKRAGSKDKLPSTPLGARAWLQYGKSVEPGYGAILVFWRGSKAGWQGHVGYYVGEDANNYYVLGGNQSDTVNVSKIAKDRLLGARAPTTLPYHSRKVFMKNNEPQSGNEA